MKHCTNKISIYILLLISISVVLNVEQQHTPVQRFLQAQNSWSLRTKLQTVENVTSLETIVTLYQGLDSSITEQSIVSKSKISRILSDPLTGSEKTTDVNISSVTIQSSGHFLTYTSSAPLQNAQVSTSRIRVSFDANTIVDSNRQAYSVLSQQYSLSQPYFYSSFYHNYQMNLVDQLLGITFTLVALILVIMSFVQTKCFHQCMAYYMLIQLIGLLRLKQYPVNQTSYSVLSGFRHTQLAFIPNLFFNLFPFAYQEQGYDSVQFEFGDNNFIRNFGSPLLIFLILQFFVLTYLAFACFSAEKESHLKRYSMIQDFIFLCFLVKLTFSIVVSIAALSMDLSKVVWTVSFAFSQLFAFLCAVAIIGYLIWIYHIPENRSNQLYKLAFIGLGISCWIVLQNIYTGVVLMLIIFIGFTIVQLIFYRHQKLNILMFIADRVIMAGVIGVAGFLNDEAGLIISLACLLGISGAFKIVYIIMGVHKIFFEDETDQTEKMIRHNISDNRLFKGENDQYSSSSHLRKSKLAVLNQSPDKSSGSRIKDTNLKVNALNNAFDLQSLASVESRQPIGQTQKLQGISFNYHQLKNQQQSLEIDQNKAQSTLLEQRRQSKGDNSYSKDDISIKSLNKAKQLLAISANKNSQNNSENIVKNMDRINEDIIFDQQILDEEKISNPGNLSNYQQQQFYQTNKQAKQNNKQITYEQEKQEEKQTYKLGQQQKYQKIRIKDQKEKKDLQNQHENKQDKHNVQHQKYNNNGQKDKEKQVNQIYQLQTRKQKKNNQDNKLKSGVNNDQLNRQKILSHEENFDFEQEKSEKKALQIKIQRKSGNLIVNNLEDIKQDEDLQQIQILKRQNKLNLIQQQKLAIKQKQLQQNSPIRLALKKAKQNTYFDQKSPQQNDLSINIKRSGVKLNVKKNIKTSRVKQQEQQNNYQPKKQQFKIQFNQFQNMGSIRLGQFLERQSQKQVKNKVHLQQSNQAIQPKLQKYAKLESPNKVKQDVSAIKKQEVPKSNPKKTKNLKNTLQKILGDDDDDDDLDSDD